MLIFSTFGIRTIRYCAQQRFGNLAPILISLAPPSPLGLPCQQDDTGHDGDDTQYLYWTKRLAQN
jgi:hypothetical protein